MLGRLIDLTTNLLIGDIIERNMRHLGVYKQYLIGYEKALKHVKKLKVSLLGCMDC